MDIPNYTLDQYLEDRTLGKDGFSVTLDDKHVERFMHRGAEFATFKMFKYTYRIDKEGWLCMFNENTGLPTRRSVFKINL